MHSRKLNILKDLPKLQEHKGSLDHQLKDIYLASLHLGLYKAASHIKMYYQLTFGDLHRVGFEFEFPFLDISDNDIFAEFESMLLVSQHLGMNKAASEISAHFIINAIRGHEERLTA